MKYSFINKKNRIVDMVDVDTYEEARAQAGDSFIVIQSEEHHVKGLDLNTYVPLTNKEKIKKGLITLAENQVYDEKSDAIFTLSADQEYRDGEVVILSKLEQYKKGIISKEEFTASVNGERELAYKEQTDKLVIELMFDYLERNKATLNNTELALLENIIEKRATIKEENPKE